jgi:microcystin-dependent protein
MSNPYIGEIRMFGGNFAPAGWAMCQGQIMPISENDTLFNLIGTTYGGDGESTFGIPNLSGRVPVHMGTGTGLSPYVVGENSGVEIVTLQTTQIPIHTHGFLTSLDAAASTDPSNQVIAQTSQIHMFTQDVTNRQLNTAKALTPVGGSQPHENMQPYLCLTFIISLFGIFPSQN